MNPVATLSASQGTAGLASVSPCAARTSSLYLSLFLVAGLSRAGDVAARSIAPERKLEAMRCRSGLAESSFVRLERRRLWDLVLFPGRNTTVVSFIYRNVRGKQLASNASKQATTN